jgi:hypothetical protein
MEGVGGEGGEGRVQAIETEMGWYISRHILGVSLMIAMALQ